eukprot:jgi/Mesen1/4628/ME000237S03663
MLTCIYCGPFVQRWLTSSCIKVSAHLRGDVQPSSSKCSIPASSQCRKKSRIVPILDIPQYQLTFDQLASTSTLLGLALGACAAFHTERSTRSLWIIDMAESTSQTMKQQMEEIYDGLRSKLKDVPEVDAKELKELLERKQQGEKIAVVDVRMDDEAAVSMIPGGVLKKKDFESRRDDFKDHIVVCYCTIGYRSGLYVQDLVKQNIDARNLKGSILAWTHEGYPLVSAYDSKAGSSSSEDEATLTKKVHTFGKKWQLQGDGYEAVVFENPPWISVIWSQVQTKLPRWLRSA